MKKTLIEKIFPLKTFYIKTLPKTPLIQKFNE